MLDHVKQLGSERRSFIQPVLYSDHRCPHPLTPVRSVQAAGSLSDHLIGEKSHRQCPKTVDGDRSGAYRIVHRRCPCHRLRSAVQSRPVKQPFSACALSDQAIKVGLGRVRSGVLRYRNRSLPPLPTPPALRHPDIPSPHSTNGSNSKTRTGVFLVWFGLS